MRVDLFAQRGLTATVQSQVVEEVHANHFSASLKCLQAMREFTSLAPRYQILSMLLPIAEIRRENLKSLASRFRTRKLMSEAIGVSEAQLSQWINGSKDSKTGKPRGMADDSCRQVESALSLEPGWMDRQHSDERPANQVVAHAVSHWKIEDAQVITWEQLMSSDTLPAIFWAELPDDSMAPRAPAGRHICFDTAVQPKAGDGVLIIDSAGTKYFRLYRAGAAGRWTAHALNPAYQDLDSERDGLAVLAVLKAEEGRWS